MFAVQSHNFTPDIADRIRASIDRAKSGLSEWAVTSDSSSTGALVKAGWMGIGTVFDHTLAWPLAMRDALGVPVAGTGLVRTLDNTMVDSRWTLPGFGWQKTGKTFAWHARNGVSPSFVTDLPGDRITVAYYDSGDAEPGSFDISTGAFVHRVNSAGPAGWKTVTVNADVPAGGTVLVSKRSGPYLAVSGICVWNSSGGLLVHNVGQGGSAAHGTGTLNDRWDDDATRESLGRVFATPAISGDLDVHFHSLGGNDLRLKVPVPDVIAAIRERVAKYPGAVNVLVGETQLNDSLVPRATHEAFLAALYDLSDELGAPLIDQDATLGPYKTIAANGWNADNNGHLKPAVLEDLGRSTAELLLTA